MPRVLADTPIVLLRLEGMMTLVASVTAYAHFGASWWLFAVLFLLPDVSIAGYAAGPKIGAATYNSMHCYGLPLAVIVVGLSSGAMMVVGIGLIWVAHIAFDRMLGYGLKDPEGFRVTHLSPSAPAAAALA